MPALFQRLSTVLTIEDMMGVVLGMLIMMGVVLGKIITLLRVFHIDQHLLTGCCSLFLLTVDCCLVRFRGTI